MFNDITSLGYGLVFFALIIGVGSVILYYFAGATTTCDATACGTGAYWNNSNNFCSNATNSTCDAPTGDAYDNTAYLLGQLGQSGLAGWTPAIIAISIGMLFLGAFLVRRNRKGRY